MKYLAVILLVFAVIVLLLSAYQVQETEQIIITQFGRPIGDAVTDAGLHFKVPFIQQVNRFEKRILQWDGEAEQVVTNDKKYIYFDTMARWRIDDPLKFLRSVRDEFGAQSRLKGIIDGAVRDAVSSHPLIELVRTTDRAMVRDLSEETEDEVGRMEAAGQLEILVGREGLAAVIQQKAAQETKELGIELIDVRVKRINYVANVLRDVYERMISERERIAARYISEGEGERAKILGGLEREMKTITSEAFRLAEEIRGEADAEAARIYAEAYERNPEFYSFLKTLETYQDALVQGDTTLVLSSRSDLFMYLKSESGGLPEDG